MRADERALLDQALAKLARSPEVSPPPASFSGYHRAAAVLTHYDIRRLRPFGPVDDPEKARQLLLADSDHVKIEDRGRWELRDDVRREVLQEMADAGTLGEAALAANRPLPTNQTQTLFAEALTGAGLRIDQMDGSQLAAALRVSDWLTGLIDDLPSSQSIKQRFEQLDLLSPFQHLAGDHFRGRAAELERLRGFAGLDDPASTDIPLRPIMLYGPGGIGKSTLVARLVLEIDRLDATHRFPWSFLDLDRPGLRPEQPLTFLIESVRQLGVQYPEARPACNQIQADWQSILAQRSSRRPGRKTSDSRTTAQVDRSGWSKELYNYVSLIRSLTAGSGPLFLVLDTFEEVQYRSPLITQNVLEFVHQLQEELPSVRVVISGRAPLDDDSMQGMCEMPLGGFDEEAARGYLQGRAVPSSVAQFILTQVDLSPLSLRLAADLWESSGKPEDTEALFGDLAAELESSEVQGILFRRILGHIHDRNDEVHKIAYPGLILRRITPEIIEKVLAEPCGLGPIDGERASQLYAELRREVALVIDEGDALRHRPDLRRIMVRLLRGRDQQRVRQIEQAAVDYYAGKTEPAARAEEIYHRLSLGQTLSALDAAWGDGTQVELRTLYAAVDELEPRQRAWLIDKLPDRSLTTEESDAARLSEWEEDTVVKVRELLSTGQDQDAQRALALLKARDKRQANSELYALEAQAYAALGDCAAAQAVLQRGLSAATRWRHYALAIELRIAQARLARVTGEPAQARQMLAVADRQVRLRDGSRLQLIEIGLERLDLQDEPDRSLVNEMAAWFDQLDNGEIIANERLMGRLAGKIGAEVPSVLWRVSDLTGIDSDRRDLLHALGRAIARWDSDLSAARQQAPGALLRQLQIPETGPLATSWAAYLLEANPSQRVALLRELRSVSDRPPQVVLTALAALMAARDLPPAVFGDTGNQRAG